MSRAHQGELVRKATAAIDLGADSDDEEGQPGCAQKQKAALKLLGISSGEGAFGEAGDDYADTAGGGGGGRDCDDGREGRAAKRSRLQTLQAAAAEQPQSHPPMSTRLLREIFATFDIDLGEVVV